MAAQIPQEPKTTEELESSIRDLSISSKKPEQDDIRRPEATNKPKRTTTTSTTTKNKSKKKKPAVADSWEDEASESSDSSGSDTEREAQQQGCGDETPISPASTNTEGPLAPPPTPISPQTLASSNPSQPWLAYNNNSPSVSRTSSHSRSPAGGGAPARRPEKQTAVAGRMIAGALGIRAPKRTEEQRAYDRAMKEQEIKRRNRAREEEAKAREEEERAKAAIWDG